MAAGRMITIVTRQGGSQLRWVSSPRMSADNLSKVHRMHGAPVRPPAVEGDLLTAKVGLCTACGSVEVLLTAVTGQRDLSDIGESATYLTGYGCEVCS